MPELGRKGNANGIVALVHREHNLRTRPCDILAPKTLEEPPDVKHTAGLLERNANPRLALKAMMGSWPAVAVAANKGQ